MVIHRKKALLNIVIAILCQVIIMVLGFVIPKLIMDSYGSDTNGLVNSITQIFGYLALLEAGIQGAAMNAFYKPLSKNDDEGVSIVASTANRYYRNVVIIYFTLMTILSFTLPFILNTNVDYWTVFTLVFFEGLTSIVSFYFTQKWSALVSADGKTYVKNVLFFLNKVLCQSLKIILAIFVVDIMYLQIGYFLISLVYVLLFYIYIKSQYKWVNFNIKTNFKLENRNALITGEIARTVFSSTDLLVLSIFSSTSMASVYSTYNMPITAFNVVLNSALASCYYLLGNSYVNDINKCKKYYDLINSFVLIAVTTLSAVTVLLLVPFVRMYTSGVIDVNYIYSMLPLFFTFSLMVDLAKNTPIYLVNISKYAKINAIFNIVAAIVNVVSSLILVQYFDVIGVIVGTCIAGPIMLISVTYLVNKKIFNRSIIKPFLTLFLNFIIIVILGVITIFYELPINSILSFIGYGIVLTILAFVLVFLINSLLNKEVLCVIKRQFKSIVAKK